MASYEGITESQVGIEASTLTLDHDVSTCSTFLHMERVAKLITSHCLVFRDILANIPTNLTTPPKNTNASELCQGAIRSRRVDLLQALAGAAREVFALQ